MTERSCEDCRFWRELPEPDHEHGECRRHAPQAQMDLALRVDWGETASGWENEHWKREVVWPTTHYQAWCGDHEPEPDTGA